MKLEGDSKHQSDQPCSVEMGSFCGCFSGLVDIAANIVPTVSENASSVPSEWSGPSISSRSPSVVSIGSDYSTLSPLTRRQLTELEEEFGPDWRDRMR